MGPPRESRAFTSRSEARAQLNVFAATFILAIQDLLLRDSTCVRPISRNYIASRITRHTHVYPSIVYFNKLKVDPTLCALRLESILRPNKGPSRLACRLSGRVVGVVGMAGVAGVGRAWRHLHSGRDCGARRRHEPTVAAGAGAGKEEPGNSGC